MKGLKLNIITPVFNEEDAIFEFLTVLSDELDDLKVTRKDVEITIVNDGSTDATEYIILNNKWRYKVNLVTLSKNFGHQVAVWFGLEKSPRNSYTIVLDSDLQDHPREISRIIDSFKKGNDVVLMQRRSRQDTIFKRITAKFYYILIGKLSDGTVVRSVADYFGLSPRAKGALLLHGESVKYLRGLIQNIGFNKEVLQYDRMSRVAGKTHYPLGKMVRLAIAGITGFSVKPLLLIAYFSLLSLAVILVLTPIAFLDGNVLTNQNSSIPYLYVCTILLGILQCCTFVVFSLYIARISLEVKNRPIAFTSNTIAIEPKGKNET